jgi:hypothetical protein
MTKLSAVMVVPTIPLDMLPPAEREVVSRFLFQTMRGIDANHTARWRRMWSRVAQGEVLQCYPIVERSGLYHRRHMAIEGRIFENQDGFPPTAAGRRKFRDWLKVGASLARLELQGEVPNWLPGSVSYEDLSDDEFREFHEAAVDYLRTPYALKKLWPAVKPAERMRMLELQLAGPRERDE